MQNTIANPSDLFDSKFTNFFSFITYFILTFLKDKNKTKNLVF